MDSNKTWGKWKNQKCIVPSPHLFKKNNKQINPSVTGIPICSNSKDSEIAVSNMTTNSNTNTRKNICVFCGSSPGKKEAYSKATSMLGQLMVERGYDLV